MQDNERGIIQNRSFGKQIVDFKGLRWGKITPTDIDGFLDFGNRHFFLIELKYNGAQLKRGQELAFERMIDNWNIKGKTVHAALIVASHNNAPPMDIDAAAAMVSKVYFGSPVGWREPNKPINLRDCIQFIRDRWAA